MLPYSALTTATPGIPEPIRELANTVRNTLCQVVPPAKWASEFVTQISGTPNLYPWLADAVCNLPGDAPRPSRGTPSRRSPNCAGQRYDVTYRFVSPSFGATPQTGTVTKLWGEIGQARGASTVAGNEELYITHYGSFGETPQPTMQRTRVMAALPATSFELTSIVPWSGAAFSPCQRPTVPPIAPDAIPPNPIPPVTLPPSWNLPNIQVPVTVRPVEIRPNVEFRPEINVDVGGINFRFGFDGWDFSISPNINAPIIVLPVPFSPPVPNVPVIPPSNVTPVNSPDCSDSPDCPDVNLAPILTAIQGTDAKVIDVRDRVNGVRSVADSIALSVGTVIEKLDDLHDCVCPPESELFTTVPNVDSFDTDFGFRITYVELELTTPPIVSKIQEGGAAPDVIYWGWAAFGVQQGLAPRVPLHYVKVRLTPETTDLTRFTYTAYNGMKATLRIYRSK